MTETEREGVGAKSLGGKGSRTRAEILDHAARLFIERGVAGTNLQDIAEAAGLTRPALYYHFQSKEDVLSALVTQGAEEAAQRLRERAQHGSFRERLRACAAVMVLWILESPARFRVMDRNEHHLPPDLAARHADGKRQVLEIFEALIKQGIAAGDLRPVDPAIAALTIIGMCNWSAWWFNPEGPLDAEHVAERVADLAVASVARGRSSPTSDGAEAAYRTIRRELRHLKTLADRAASSS